MKVLDLRECDTKCVVVLQCYKYNEILFRWRGNQEVEIIALKGIQAGQVEMWAEAMKEKGVKILDKNDGGDKIVYKVYLP